MNLVVYRNEKEVELNLLKPLFRDMLGYADVDLRWNFPVQISAGRERQNKFADLVVHHKNKPVITVEAKSPTETIISHLGQLDSYAFHLQTPYSVITNGRQFVLRGYYSHNNRFNVIDESVNGLEVDRWAKVQNLISQANISASMAETLNVVASPNSEKILDYRRFFRRIHNTIRDRDKLDPAAAFDELSKLLFLKAAEDEKQAKPPTRSVLTPDMVRAWESLDKETASHHINGWFRSATKGLFEGVFDDQPQINLSVGTLASVLGDMANFHVKNGDVDVKGRAFEEFLPSQLRGEGLGQFFTPRPIVDFMATLAEISIHDVVADFACGSGGFLIKAYEQMKRGVEQMPDGMLRRMGTTRNELLEEIKSQHLYGIDAEPRAARTAKMNMLMWGDGKKVVRGNALASSDHSGKPYELTDYDSRNQSSGCTLILANPPFGSREKDSEVLSAYKLGGELVAKRSEKTEILFIEKGLKLLRPEGRMLIVLPQGIISGVNNARVRDYIHSQAEVRAVISLPTHAFVQSGVPTVNTCVLYVQKFTDEKKRLYDEKTKGLNQPQIRTLLRSDSDFDYSIFMGTAEFVGYEPSGRMIILPDEKTDLDLLLDDYAIKDELPQPDINLFEFASRYYGEKALRRKDQKIRGTEKGLKTAFCIKLSDTEERLDPPFYLFRDQAGELVETLLPLKAFVSESKGRLRITSEDDLDREYRFASVSSDGIVSVTEYVRGEDFSPSYRPKIVSPGDFVYNPMRVNIGSIGIIPDVDGQIITSPDYIVFKSENVNPEYLLSLLRSPFYRMYIDVITTGSIRDRLQFENLKALRVPPVLAAEQSAVSEMVRRINGEIRIAMHDVNIQKAKAVDRIHRLVEGSAVRTQSEALGKSFYALAERWKQETAFHSSLTKKIQHPAYRAIIALGSDVVPFILREIQTRPGHWFSALEEITGESPVSETDRKSVQRSTRAWVSWGYLTGLLDAGTLS